MEPELTPEATEAVHKAKSAAQAVEMAREAQIAKLADETALRTKEAMIQGLREVFGQSDSKDPEQMTVLIRRIPILCKNVAEMHDNLVRNSDRLKSIENNIQWGVRVVIGAVITGIIAFVIRGGL